MAFTQSEYYTLLGRVTRYDKSVFIRLRVSVYVGRAPLYLPIQQC